MICSWLTLLSDSPLKKQHGNKPLRLYVKFLNRIKRDGLKVTVLSFSSLAHKLVSQPLLMGESPENGDFISDFLDTPVFMEYYRYFKTGDTDCLRYLYTFLNFLKKGEYIDPEFNSIAFRDWIGIEDRLSRLSFDEVDILSLKTILSIVLPVFDIDSFFPKFGNGSVSERGVRTRGSKIKNFDYDPLIDRFIFHGHIGKYGYGDESGLSSTKVVPNILSWDPARRVSSRIARMHTVKKDWKSVRTICMEPNTLQFFQQGIMRRMLELVQKSRLSDFINLSDQSRNKSLAQFGSFTSLIDTIDLSSASDCLSLELVKKIFPPSWLIPMIVTRSHSCLTPGGIKRLEKFAPMGSALCFPTQCILFTCVVIMAACIHSYELFPYTCTFEDWLASNIINVIDNFMKTPRYDNTRYQPCAVYGDDICVDQKLTPIVMAILDRLGFIVNRQKSFVGSQVFRESCGGFYLNGDDITPVYFRVKNCKTLNAEYLASSVTLANQCYLSGYYSTYRLIVRDVLYKDTRFRHRNDKNSIPFVEAGSDQFGFYSIKPHNEHLISRYNSNLQRDEFKCVSLSYDINYLANESCEDYEYMRWMATHTSGFFRDDFSSHLKYDTAGCRCVWRWTPYI
jgi:hypothetical protein